MPCLRFTAASEEEINLITNALQAAGYIVTQISSREIEFEFPVPEEAEVEESLIAESGQTVTEAGVPATDGIPTFVRPELPREFVLAPLFRSMAALASDIRFHVRRRVRIGWSGSSRQVHKIWHTLTVVRRLKAVERNLSQWEESALEQPVKRIEIPSAPRKKTPKEMPVVSPQTADRIGWVMAAVSGGAALIVVWLGLSSHPVNPVMRPESTQAAGETQTQLPSPASAAAAVMPAKLEKSPAAKTKHHARASREIAEDTTLVEDTPDVVVRHFAPPRTRQHVQQVAGVKHFSDME